MRLFVTFCAVVAVTATIAYGLEAHSRPTGCTTRAGTFNAVVADVMRFVEAQRGLHFKYRPHIRIDPNFALPDHSTAKDRQDDEQTELVFKALGLLAPGDNLHALLSDYGDARAAGVYDPKTRTLTVDGARITPFVRVVLAHELTHALDDQYFNLNRPQLAHLRDERQLGFWTLMEGDAVYVETAYTNSLSACDRAAARRERMRGYDKAKSRFSPFLREYMDAPYIFGPWFVHVLRVAGGPRAVDAAFRDPPTSSEQVMFPDHFLAGDRPKSVPAPRADGQVVTRGVLGAELLAYLIEPGQGTRTAALAAAGWGGDRYVGWWSGHRPCARVAIAGDTRRETAEIRDALRAWARAQPDASVAPTAIGVELTACGAPVNS